MSLTAALILKIGSYIADFAIGFFSNKAWDWVKAHKSKGVSTISVTQNQDKVVTINAHIETSDPNVIEKSSQILVEFTGANKKVIR